MSSLQVIPDGYKQTDYGVIPEDWNFKTIGEIASVSSGGTPNRKVPEFWDGDIPWVTTTLINGHAISYANEYITKKGLDFSSAKMCRSGTLLMAMYGQGKTRGKVGVLSFDASINQACAAISLTDSRSNEYVLHVLNSMYEDIRELSNSGGQENLSGGIIKGISIPFPSFEEQTAIANALSDVDALLSELEKLIAKKQAIKTATMQQLLTGKTRLPQFSIYSDGDRQGQIKGTKPSELGEIPEDWASLTLDDVCCFVGGAQPEKSTFSYKQHSDYIRLIQIRDYKSDKNTVYIPEKLARKKCDKNDIMIGRYGPPIFQILRGLEGAYNVALIKAIPANCINREFLYYILKDEKLFELMDMLSQRSSGQTGVELPALKAYPIGLPSDKEQTAIAAILTDMDEEIQALQQRLSKTRQIKQGMMQELLTGKTRLPFEKSGDMTLQGEPNAN
ncbi:restriction endonuclease subunit S [Vibrio atlanticus]|uniref:restriction endonuclease subunit S n=1 Tax=Vibrio atlanticus TaxID=693153 RepID=UPI00354E606F